MGVDSDPADMLGLDDMILEIGGANGNPGFLVCLKVTGMLPQGSYLQSV
jgi:hypothetical protein